MMSHVDSLYIDLHNTHPSTLSHRVGGRGHDRCPPPFPSVTVVDFEILRSLIGPPEPPLARWTGYGTFRGALRGVRTRYQVERDPRSGLKGGEFG